MSKKTLSRQRRARRGRMKLRELGVVRLSVHRSLKHIYAQLLVAAEGGDKVLACASTLDKSFKGQKLGSNIPSAKLVGKLLAERASQVLTEDMTIGFDRSGYKYHGCIKALADAAREAGLSF